MATPWKNIWQKNEEKTKISTSSKGSGFSSKCFCRHIETRYNKFCGFFSRKSNKMLQKDQIFLSTINLLKTIAFLQNIHLTNRIQFWQPCLFGQKPGRFPMSFRKTLLKFWREELNQELVFFSKKLVFFRKIPWTHVKQF